MSGWAGWQSSAAFAQGLSSAGSSVVDSEVASRVPTQPSQYFLQGEFGASAAHSLRPAEDSHSTLSVQPPAPQQGGWQSSQALCSESNYRGVSPKRDSLLREPACV